MVVKLPKHSKMAPTQGGTQGGVDYKLTTFLQGSLTLDDYVWSQEEWPKVAYNDYNDEDTVPIIDISLLRSEDAATRSKGLKDLMEAAREWGFFRLVNHGVLSDVTEKLESDGKELFALPLEQKKKAVRLPESIIGYYFGAESVFSKAWLEAFHFSGDKEVTDNMIRQVSPENFNELSASVHNYIDAYQKLAIEVVELMAIALGLEPSTFSKYTATKGDKSTVRVCYYPPCPQPQQTLGQRPHADPILITIVHQDDVGGLQILKNNRWIAVKPEPGTVVVNVGDTLQVLSNDIYPSVQHQVVLNSERSRLSMAFFLIPEADALIVPAKGLVDDEHPVRHPPFIYRDYRKSYGERRAVGKSHLESFYTLKDA
uniref:Gibberellin 20-oxidase-like protein n=1 Tax=Selaginella moellendorffii TaxID=88036 RepID=A9LY21_SELML|nr:gibberellin 20-oxidase-like protein [Selaginella moellendorffii]